MRKLFEWWPLMLKSTHEEMRRENWELRGALTRANAELRKHRLLLGSLSQGNPEVTEMVEKAIKKVTP